MNTNTKMKTPENESWNFPETLQKLATERAAFANLQEEQLIEKAASGTHDDAVLETYIRDSGQRRVINALRTGYIFQALKDRYGKEGDWVKFMKEKLPGYSSATIYRYLAIAEAFPDPTKVPHDLTITKAYAILAITGSKKEESKDPGKTANKKTIDAKDLKKELASIHKFVGKLTASDFLTSVRPKQINPIVAQLNSLIADLEKLRSAVRATQEKQGVVALDGPEALPSGNKTAAANA